MLPSLRLIVVGFLCGFVTVYAGLRMATSLNAIHQAFPIAVAQAAPASTGGMSTVRIAATPPYDKRFVVNAAAGAPVFASITPEALERIMPPPLPAEEVPEPGTTTEQPPPHADEPPMPMAAIAPSASPAVEQSPPAAREPDPLPSPELTARETALASAPAVPDMPVSAALAPDEPETAAQVAPMQAKVPVLTAENPATSSPDDAAPAVTAAPAPQKAAPAKRRTATKPARKRHRVARR